MTSSLVGSEMCIRDRCEHMQQVPSYMIQCACVPCPCIALQNASGHTPVSYTHLTLPTICSV
eukprot:4610582-Prorocentrum_lima.AAC.1